jgi:hypothetical protein
MSGLRLATLAHYQEVPCAWIAEVTKTAITRCIEAQRLTACDYVRSHFIPDRSGGHIVSARALAPLLRDGGEDPDSIRERNMIGFNLPFLGPLMHDRETARLRGDVDRALSEDLGALFVSGDVPALVPAGHFWYPPGGYRAWHTNVRQPGWRLYVTYCDEPGRSYFRYRDPTNGEIVTSLDDRWTARVFGVQADWPLWHAVYSETNRFSFGYRLQPGQLP